MPSLQAAASRQDAEPIDYGVLERVVPDSAAQVQVLHDFQTHVRTGYANLLQMLAQGDLTNAEREAHRIKGSCQMVGAKDIANACATIEQMARDGDMAGASAGKGALDAAIGQFDAYMAEIGKPKAET